MDVDRETSRGLGLEKDHQRPTDHPPGGGEVINSAHHSFTNASVYVIEMDEDLNLQARRVEEEEEP